MKNTLVSVAIGVFALAAVVLLLPFTGNVVVHSKMFLLFFVGITVTFLYVFTSLREKAMQMILSPMTLPLALFGVAAFISTQFTRQYPTENYLDLGGAFIALTAIGLLGSVLFGRKQFNTFLTILCVGSSIMVIDSLLQMVGFGSSQLVAWMLNARPASMTDFTLVGSVRVALQVVGLSLIGVAFQSFQERKIDKIQLGTLLFLVIGLGLYGWILLANRNTPSFATPSYSASWSIALDSLKSPNTALFGIGPSNYRNAYNAFKPVWLNSTEQWTIPFSQASNAPLTILTTMGFVGLVTWIWFIVVVFLEMRKSHKASQAILAMLLATLLFQLFSTFNYVTLLLQGLLIALYIGSERERFAMLQFGRMKASVLHSHGNQYSYESVVPLYAFSLVLVALTGYITWFTSKNYMALATMYRSFQAAQNNDVVKSYELSQKAIQLSPFIDAFHRDYASTNMAIAIALSNKADINEQEKAQVGQLLQQAVREARNATIIDPNDTENWIVLAQIYKDMIAVTKDAQEWAVQTYARAIETNPTNPYLRILLGNVFAELKDHQRAINLYNQAIELKPDLPEAYYRIAQSLIAVDQLQQAETALRATLSLLSDSTTEEYTTVSKQLEEVQQKIKDMPAADEGTETTSGVETSPTPTPNANTTPVVAPSGDEVNTSTTNDVAPSDLEQVESTPQTSPTPASAEGG